MNRFSFIAWLGFPVLAGLVFAAAPAAAQVATTNNQVRPATQSGIGGSAPAPTTGVFCIEEMTANFCNVVAGPNTGGYGARNSSGSSSGPGGSTASIPPCPAEPPFNELCN
jgi:hypothetical protein